MKKLLFIAFAFLTVNLLAMDRGEFKSELRERFTNRSTSPQQSDSPQSEARQETMPYGHTWGCPFVTVAFGVGACLNSVDMVLPQWLLDRINPLNDESKNE